MTMKKLNETAQMLLVMLFQMPYASAADLKGWPLAKRARVDANLKSLVENDFVGYETLGWMRDAQRRYFLKDRGVAWVNCQIPKPAGWSLSHEDRETIRSYGPALECIYHVAPQIWNPDWIPVTEYLVESDERPDGWFNHYAAGDEEPQSDLRPIALADSFTWLRRGPLHALVGMEQGPDLRPFWVPLIWHGTHAPTNSLPEKLYQLFGALTTESGGENEPAYPPGVVNVCQDPLAAARADRETPSGIPRLTITYGARAGEKLRFGITNAEPMRRAAFPCGFGRVLGANLGIISEHWPDSAQK